MELKKQKNILSNARTKETYRSKIANQSNGSQKGVFLSIGNFENFCMQEYGKPHIIPDMLQSTEIEVYDTLQKWISYMNNAQTKRIFIFIIFIYFNKVMLPMFLCIYLLGKRRLPSFL
jgi:hypothetical protein